MRRIPKLLIVVPCYNEEAVLPVAGEILCKELASLTAKGFVSADSGVLFVDDGSQDRTWDIISGFAASVSGCVGIRQSRNRGHQNALWAGLMEARRIGCDITVTIDCDGQDDVNAIKSMVAEYMNGAEIVYGVRNDRSSDTFFKRFTAECFYRLQLLMGIETVYNHADYRLLSSVVLDALSRYREVNLYLRGLIPLVGFKSAKVEYRREKRICGGSHYGFMKMLTLAGDGITSLTVSPIRFIAWLGVAFAALGAVALAVSFVSGADSAAKIASAVFFVGGCNMLSLGVVGEYVGKMYLEVKNRPRDVISDRTFSVPVAAADKGMK